MSTTTHAPFRSAAHNLFRVVAGFLFWQHGAQKLFGWFGGTQVDLVSLLGLAGVLEFFGGLLIVAGLFTRPVALVLAGEMIVAYFIQHAFRALMPIQNGGELALLYCVGFLLLATLGSGSFSVDAARSRAAAAGPARGAGDRAATGTGAGADPSGRGTSADPSGRGGSSDPSGTSGSSGASGPGGATT